jgi:hypothetical protein
MWSAPFLRSVVLGATVCVYADASHAVQEEWKFIFAIASSNWDVRSGTAVLERAGSSFKGEFADAQGIKYKLTAKTTGNSAVGRIVILESGHGTFDMKGTYTRRTFRDVSPCLWQTIQLYDGFHFFSLLRTEDTCKP